MKLPPFTLHRPDSVGQASRLLAELGDDGAAYCGGTELLLAMKLGLASYEHLVDLKRVHGLRGITAGGDGGVRIGAATTHHEIETSAALRARYPEMPAMISQVANLRVRSVGTLGGNLCFADPHSDPASFLMAVDAVLVCQPARRSAGCRPPVPDRPVPDRPGPRRAADRRRASRPPRTRRPLAPADDADRTPGGHRDRHGYPARKRRRPAARLIVGSVGSVPFAADTAALTGPAADFDGPGQRLRRAGRGRLRAAARRRGVRRLPAPPSRRPRPAGPP